MNDDPKDFERRWERRLHDELRQLPDCEAPDTLAPNVMAFIRSAENQRARTWYRRPFLQWPRAMQLVFGSGTLALFALLAWGAPALWTQLPGWPEPPVMLARGIAELNALATAARGLLDALYLAAATFLTPVRIAIVAALIVSQITLLGVSGSIWRHLIVQRTRGFRENLLPFQS